MTFLMTMTGPEQVFSKKLAQIVYDDEVSNSQADSSDNNNNDRWDLADERDMQRLMVDKSAGKANSQRLYYMFCI